MTEKLKKGDTVKLKSGGPVMTVNNYVGIAPGVPTSTVICNWFVGTKLEQGKFDEDSLVPAAPLP